MMIRERRHQARLDLVTRRGHEYLSLENELMRVTFVLSKGADVVELRHKPSDIDALWRSPHPLNPPGLQVPTIALSRGSFFDYYEGGWQEVMPAGGGPCTYREAEIGLHGEAMFLPWNAEVLEDRPERVSVRLSVSLRRTPFTVERTITLAQGEASFAWHGRIRNEGEEALHFMWGQHICFGAPFIGPGVEIDLPSAVVHTLDKVADNARFAPSQQATWPHVPTLGGDMARADLVLPKEARTRDSYTIVPQEGWYAVRNKALDLGLLVSWDRAAYPYLWAWQAYGGAWGYPYYGRAYALALEPFSSPAGSLTANVARGAAPLLEPGAELSMGLKAGFFVGAGAPVIGVAATGEPQM